MVSGAVDAAGGLLCSCRCGVCFSCFFLKLSFFVVLFVSSRCRLTVLVCFPSAVVRGGVVVVGGRYIGKAREDPETLNGRLYLHYEFPPYCVNETGKVRDVRVCGL